MTTLSLIILAVLFLTIILIYNSLINRKNKLTYAYSTIDVMLKKRMDLIPNLITSVKEYMKHENSLLTEITKIRTSALEKNITDGKRFELENQLSTLLGKINIAVEAYPNLKASQNFIQLQNSFNEIEEQISAARRAYNYAVYDFNNGVEMFPFSIFASLMKYEKKTSFEIPESQRSATDIDAKAFFNQK